VQLALRALPVKLAQRDYKALVAQLDLLERLDKLEQPVRKALAGYRVSKEHRVVLALQAQLVRKEQAAVPVFLARQVRQALVARWDTGVLFGQRKINLQH
jgi:hypothetical protein